MRINKKNKSKERGSNIHIFMAYNFHFTTNSFTRSIIVNKNILIH